MRTRHRTAAVLILAAIAYLGTGCEQTEPPTGARPLGLITTQAACSVPTLTYPTIQAAVNDPNCNPIVVAPGIYPEPTAPGPLTINRTLTLQGPHAGVDARGRVALEAQVTNTQGTFITASNVVIDGFTFEGSVSPAFTGFGVLIGAGTSGAQILNNIVQNNIAGIGLGGSQVLIQHNQIRNNNQLPGVGGASGTGIYTDEFVSQGAVTNVLIEENAFVSNDDAGIDVSNTALPGVSNFEVSHNSFNLNGRAVVFFNTHTSSIHDNSITNSTFVGSAAIRLFDNNSDLTFMNNDLSTGAGHAIRFSFLGLVGGASSGVVFHENNIGTMGSASFVLDGLLVDAGSTTATVDAECNWWGSATGPTSTSNPGGTGEEVVGNADFTPWLIAPAPGGACAGGGPAGKVTGGGQVPVNLTGGKASFGFNAKSDGGLGSGHLNYLNHVTRAHLDCTVNAVLIMPPNKARLSGPCSSTNAGGAMSFTADVEDNGNPGKGQDKFTISYGTALNEGGTLTSGNIVIHQ